MQDIQQKNKTIVMATIGAVVIFGIVAFFGFIYNREDDEPQYNDAGDDELVISDTLNEAYDYIDLLSIVNSCIREPELKMQDIGLYQNMGVLIYVIEGTIADQKTFYVVNLDFINELCTVQERTGDYQSIADIPVDLSEANQSLSKGNKVYLNRVIAQDDDIIRFYVRQKLGYTPQLEAYDSMYLDDRIIFTARDRQGKKYTINAKTVLDYTLEVEE